MKTCPYCAEEIQDAAIKCRWCLSWLVDEVPSGAEGVGGRLAGAHSRPTEPEAAPAAAEPMTAEPMAAEPMTAEPMTAEPEAEVATPLAAEEPPPVEPITAPMEPAPAEAAPAAEPAPAVETKVEFTHTGSRYLLGYGGDYFGVWDRNAPQQPIERFPRTDEGWASAWARYTAIETNWMDLRTGQKSG